MNKLGAEKIFALLLVAIAFGATQLPLTSWLPGADGGQQSAAGDQPPQEVIAVPATQPEAVQIASGWPAPSVSQRPRVVCRQGLCAARQGRLVATGKSVTQAEQRLQRGLSRLKVATQGGELEAVRPAE